MDKTNQYDKYKGLYQDANGGGAILPEPIAPAELAARNMATLRPGGAAAAQPLKDDVDTPENVDYLASLFDGEDLTGVHYRRIVQAGLIQVPEGRKIFPNLTVIENLELGAFTRARNKIAENMAKVFETFPSEKSARISLPAETERGIYFLRGKINGETFSRKIIVQK